MCGLKNLMYRVGETISMLSFKQVLMLRVMALLFDGLVVSCINNENIHDLLTFIDRGIL